MWICDSTRGPVYRLEADQSRRLARVHHHRARVRGAIRAAETGAPRPAECSCWVLNQWGHYGRRAKGEPREPPRPPGQGARWSGTFPEELPRPAATAPPEGPAQHSPRVSEGAAVRHPRQTKSMNLDTHVTPHPEMNSKWVTDQGRLVGQSVDCAVLDLGVVGSNYRQNLKMKYFLKNGSQGHLDGSVSYVSESWFQLRSPAWGRGIQPCAALCVQQGIGVNSLPSVPLPTCTHTRSLSSK